MRFEIDKKRKIVDVYMEDDFGREHREGMSFEEAEAFCRKLLLELLYR